MRAPHATHARGYVMIVVLVAAAFLAGIGGALVNSKSRTSSETEQQVNNVRAVHAAEGAVVWGVHELGELLKTNPGPTTTELHALPSPTLNHATFGADDFKVDYVDPNNNYSIINPGPPSMPLVPLSSGTFAGLNAQQLPIQVLATANVKNAKATIADIVRLELIPIFQFGIFYDQPIEFHFPEPSTWTGRMHSNGGIYFNAGADDIEINGDVTTAGRIHLRGLSGGSSTTSHAPVVNGVSAAIKCDNASSSPLACPGGMSWKAWTEANLPTVRDEAHNTPEVHLPTGTDSSSFTHPDTSLARVRSEPDVCGINDATRAPINSLGVDAPLSADWQLIDRPRGADTPALKEIKYAYRAGIRVIDGVWEKKGMSGAYSAWFAQGDGSTESSCVYYGYSPNGSGGTPLAGGDGVPAIRDIRFWDYQDRRLRRVLAVDVHRLTRCLPDLESMSFNGVLYFGETLDNGTGAATDNWGLNPDDNFYAGSTCNSNFVNLPHYLRGQYSSTVGDQPFPAYLRNDNAAGNPRLDNPYYPSGSHCAPRPGRPIGLGDGPYRLPQGNNNGIREAGRGELLENGVMLTNAHRLPNIFKGGHDQGFTFATNLPLYLKGDINVKVGTFSSGCDQSNFPSCGGYTDGKVPASVVADAVTFLSDQFNDLNENPFAPVGPLAVQQALYNHSHEGVLPSGSDEVSDEQLSGTERHWTTLRSAYSGGPTGTAVALDTDFEPFADDPNGRLPASPAPCVNLLREMVLRRRIDLSSMSSPEWNDTCNATDCGQTALKDGTFGRDWTEDFAGTDLRVDTRNNGSADVLPDDRVRSWFRMNNAFVAYAPLEQLVDLELYRKRPGQAGFSTRAIPSEHDAREAVRDWMRCSLNSRHHLSSTGSLNGIRYGTDLGPRQILGREVNTGNTRGGNVQPQAGGSGDPQFGMKNGDGAEFDVTYRNILGLDGWAPLDREGTGESSAVYHSGGGSRTAFFTRDRSSLRDNNGRKSPDAIADDLSNLSAAAQGDQLAMNLSILAGTTWGCGVGRSFPSYGSNYARPQSMSGVDTSPGGWWVFTGSDEGLYGMFRYQESWYELDRFGIGDREYIDFFINGSVVSLFHSPESNGRHITNQGFLPNALGCGGQDNNQTQGRNCRLSPGFEYSWESSRRSIKYDPDNNAPDGLPPGVPAVVNHTRLRWIRR